MLFTRGQRIVFIGDSITDAGRRTTAPPYGNGYVSMVRNLIVARYPALRLTFINRGVNGNTVRDLANRWQNDVITQRPDWLSVMVGINACWRFFRNRADDGMPLPEYETTLRRLLQRTRSTADARLILMQPYVIEPDRGQPMRKMMDRYGAVVRLLAQEYDAVLVPTQEAWDAALADSQPTDWAEDQIHPTAAGHAVIALAFLRAVGFEL